MTKNPRPTAKSVGTVWYRQALQKNSQHFTESLSLHELRVTLFQKGIISQKEKQQLQKENSNHGDIAESEKLLDFLLNKEEEKLKEFVYTLTYHDKLPYQKLGKLINDTQSKLSKGIGHEDDDGHGGIMEKLTERYNAEKFRVDYPIPHDDSLRFDVADKSRVLYYKCKAKMINQERLDELKAKTDPKYIIPEYNELKVVRIEEVFSSTEELMMLKRDHAPKWHRRSSSVLLSTMGGDTWLSPVGSVACRNDTESSFRRTRSASVISTFPMGTMQGDNRKASIESFPQSCSEKDSVSIIDVYPRLAIHQLDSKNDGTQDGDVTLIVPNLESENEIAEANGSRHTIGSLSPKTKLYICAGDAGMGKTTLLKRLAYKWTLQESKAMRRFSAVLVIPLRSVNFEDSLKDLIASIGLLSKDDAENLVARMHDPDFASKVLFMLDGCDEVTIPKESAVRELIEGSLFPGTHVFVTVRPDTATYQKLCQLHPFVMVKMIGTETSSIRQYLKTNLKLKVEQVDKLLEKNMFDFDILSKPLYLTMFCAMYDKDIPISTPETNTDLFNHFMTMTVKREIQRFEIQNTSKVKQREVRSFANMGFKRSPLEPESTIPTDVKHNVYFVGKMAYEGLLQDKQTFTEDDLQEHMLNIQILDCTGLFCFGKDDQKRNTSFFRHKLMQEYMAALYIAKEGFKVQSLCELVEKASREQKPSLQTIFAKVQQPVQMACGLSLQFYREVLQKAKPYASITKDKFQECNIQAQFEFSLCFEAGCKNEEVTKEMEDYMLEVPVMERDIGGHEPCSSYHKRCIAMVTSQFSQETCTKLLKRWYDIDTSINRDSNARLLSPLPTSVRPRFSTDHIAHDFNICNGIGLVCLSILSRFTYPDVTSLFIKGQRGAVDIQRFFVIFPRLRDVDMLVNFPIDLPQDLELKHKLESGEYCKSVKKFTQKGRTHMKLPLPSVTCLMSQPNLEYLSLYGIDILSNMEDSIPCKWSNLSTLKMIWCDITKKNTQKVVHILRHTAKLTLLDLSENQSLELDTLSLAIKEMSNLTTLNLRNISLTKENTGKLFAMFKNARKVTHLNLSDNNGLDIHTLCQAILKHLHHLEELKLFQSLSHDETMCLADFLPKLENLKRLGVYSKDIQKAEDTLVEKLLLMKNMKELEVQVEEWQFATALSVSQKQKLKEKGINVYELAAA